MTNHCGGNLPDGCIDPSDLDYYDRVNGPEQDEDEEDDEDEEEWHDLWQRDYQDACRLGS